MFQRTSRRTGGATTPAAGSVTLSQLADLGQGQTLGRAVGAGTGSPQALTGVQLGQSVRRESFVVDSTSSGSVTTYTVATTTTQVNFKVNVDVTIHGMTASSDTFGKMLTLQVDRGFTGTVTFVDDSGSAGSSLERLRNYQSRPVVIRAGESATYEYWDSRWRLMATNKLADTSMIDSVRSFLAIPFMVYVSCPSGGAAGTADDVTIWNAAAPFAMRIIDAQLRVSAAVGGSSAALRTASGGGGSVVLPDPAAATQTFSTAATGVLEDLATATATVAANGSLFLRRSDRSVVGELMLTCIRT
jgi:hypothetical protein